MRGSVSVSNRDVLRWFWKFSRKYKWLILLGVVATVSAGAIEASVPILYKRLVDGLANAPSSFVLEALFFTLLLILGCKATAFILFRVGILTIILVEPRVIEDAGSTSFHYVLRHAYQFFSDAFAGSLTRKITRSASAYEQMLDQLFFTILPLCVNVIVAMMILAWRSPIIALTASAWFFAAIAFNIFFIRLIQPIDVARAKKDSEVSAAITDAFSNSINIKLFDGYDFEQHRALTIMDEWRRLMMKGWIRVDVSFLVQGLLFVAVEGTTMYFAIRLWSAGKLTTGDFILLQSLLTLLFARIQGVQHILRRLFTAFSDAREAVELLEMPHGVIDTKSAKPLVVRAGGAIEFDHVAFSYKQTQRILQDFSLAIAPGERVALVGPSGSGKSTVIKALFRFYDLDHGKISIDGQNIARVTQDSLHDALSLVPQDPSLFHRSLKDNIRYGKRDATDAEVIRAAKLAHCHEFIARLPEGYDTFVGERGIKLSGGERQRVAIARAILKNAPILVLDEATSSLDSESESLIQDALKTLMQHKTTIVIAHRLSTIMQMDRIVVMKDGVIKDIGSHEELLQQQNGLYKKLWDIQAGGFLVEEGER